MTKLLWDQVGERFYEAGIDRGVLYLSDGSGVAWSGLTSVEEDFGGDGTSPVYFDGVKTRDVPSIGDFAATLKAFTYPEEFLEFEGIQGLGNGLFVSDQPNTKTFGLSYRTRVGDDSDTTDHRYKIHVVYNVMAVPDAKGRDTNSDSPSALDFSWRLSSTPAEASGYRPTAHVIFDTRYLSESRVNGIETILYGDANDNARLPPLSELIDTVLFWDPKEIVSDSINGLSQLVAATPGSGDLTQVGVEGVYVSLPTNNLVESDVEGFYQLA